MALANQPNLDQEFDRVCCIGAGRVGILSMLALSVHWPNITFVILDNRVSVINDLNAVNRRFPFEEPNMGELLDGGIPNVVFSNNIAEELAQSRLIFVAVDVRVVNRPRQLRGDMDVRNVENAIKAVLTSMDGNLQEKYVALKSTLPVDHRGSFLSRLSRYPHFDRLNIVINPEFCSIGTAVNDLLHPPRVIFGEFHREGVDVFGALYMPLIEHDEQRIDNLPLNSAELGKLFSNAARASQLTVINIASTLCEELGGSFSDVIKCMNLKQDHQSLLTESRPGFGGLGLNKDVSYLAFLCEQVGLNGDSLFFRGLLRMRREKMDRLVQTILSKIGSVKRIGWCGFASKVGTDDLQEAPSIYICSALLRAHDMTLVIHDPVLMMDEIPASLPRPYRARVRVVEMEEDFWNEQAQAYVFMHKNDGYRTMLENHHVMLIESMVPPKYIFDCCGLVDQINAASLQYISVRANIYRLGLPW